MPINFNEDDKVADAFIKWEKVGNKVQGTLIGKRQKPNDLKPGEMQWIYELLTEDDNIVLVGGKPGIDMQMKHIKLGQIVELRYVEEKKSKRPGLSPTKIIQVYTRKDAMNEEWLNNQEALAREETTATAENRIQDTSDDGEIKLDEIPFDDPKPAVADPQASAPATADEKKALIIQLAKEKLGVAEENVMQKVMEVTGLAFIASNFSSIIDRLKKM